MKFTTLAAVAAAVAMPFAVASAAHAEDEKGALEIGYTRASFDEAPKFAYNSVHLRASGRFAQHFGAEMEAAFGGSDTITVSGVPVDVKQQWELAIYGVGYLPVGHDIDLLARIGYGRTRSKVSAGSYSADADDHGAAAGVGARYFPKGGMNGIRVDYTHYFYPDLAGNAFSVGYVRKF